MKICTPTERQMDKEAKDFDLDIIARWHIAHRKAQLRWAEMDLQSRFDTREKTLDADYEALQEMERAEALIADHEPRTVEGARRFIEMALTILEHRESHSEHTLSQGPVVQIIQNAFNALDWLDGRIPLNAETQRTIHAPECTTGQAPLSAEDRAVIPRTGGSRRAFRFSG